MCTKYCCKSLTRQSSGVQERINPFYINSYGENSFGLRTFRFTNDLQERIKFVNRSLTVYILACYSYEVFSDTNSRKVKLFLLLGIIFLPHRCQKLFHFTTPNDERPSYPLTKRDLFSEMSSVKTPRLWILSKISGCPRDQCDV